jgi:hypothetical protein
MKGQPPRLCVSENKFFSSMLFACQQKTAIIKMAVALKKNVLLYSTSYYQEKEKEKQR